MAEGFETMRMLGSGAGGAAYLSRRRADGQLVVVKHLPLKGLSRTEARYAQSELAVMRSLAPHPFIVDFYDSFEAASLPTGARAKPQAAGSSSADELHLVMEYCAGGTLQDRIDAARKQPSEEAVIPAAEVLRLFSHVTLGVRALHSAGILHRDLKAENIFLTSSDDGGTAKLGDFGLSRQLEGPLDVATTTVGTPHHLSPELCSGQPYGSASDIWALGCILHELTTLQWLVGHDGQSLPQIVLALMRAIDYQSKNDPNSGKVNPLRDKYMKTLTSRYAAADPVADGEHSLVCTFDALLQGCLAKEPSERQTAAGLLACKPLVQRVADNESRLRGLPLVAELLATDQQHKKKQGHSNANSVHCIDMSLREDDNLSGNTRDEAGLALEVEEEIIASEWPPSPVLSSRSAGLGESGCNIRGGAKQKTGGGAASYDTNGDGFIDSLDTNGDGLIDTRLGRNGSRVQKSTASAVSAQGDANAAATHARSGTSGKGDEEDEFSVEVESSIELLVGQSMEFDARPSPKAIPDAIEQQTADLRGFSGTSATTHSGAWTAGTDYSGSSVPVSMSVSVHSTRLSTGGNDDADTSHDTLVDEIEVEAEDYADDRSCRSAAFVSSKHTTRSSGGLNANISGSRSNSSTGRGSVAWSIESEQSNQPTGIKLPAAQPDVGTQRTLTELETLLAAAEEKLAEVSAELLVSQRENRQLTSKQKTAKRTEAKLARLEAQLTRLGICIDVEVDISDAEDESNSDVVDSGDDDDAISAADCDGDDQGCLEHSPVSTSVTTSRIMGL